MKVVTKMSEACIICYEGDYEDHPGHPPNCPNCGRFLKWNGWDEGYSCKCGGVITIFGSGDPEIDDADSALRVCKISHLQSSEEKEVQS